MKISELIDKLKELKAEHGDLKVRYFDYECGSDSVDQVEIRIGYDRDEERTLSYVYLR